MKARRRACNSFLDPRLATKADMAQEDSEQSIPHRQEGNRHRMNLVLDMDASPTVQIGGVRRDVRETVVRMAAFVLVAALGALEAWQLRFIQDDAYISFRYADNF